MGRGKPWYHPAWLRSARLVQWLENFKRLAALVSLRVRGGLVANAFTRSAQEAGFNRAGVSVCAPASLSDFAGLLSSVNAILLIVPIIS